MIEIFILFAGGGGKSKEERLGEINLVSDKLKVTEKLWAYRHAINLIVSKMQYSKLSHLLKPSVIASSLSIFEVFIKDKNKLYTMRKKYNKLQKRYTFFLFSQND